MHGGPSPAGALRCNAEWRPPKSRARYLALFMMSPIKARPGKTGAPMGSCRPAQVTAAQFAAAQVTAAQLTATQLTAAEVVAAGCTAARLRISGSPRERSAALGAASKARDDQRWQ